MTQWLADYPMAQRYEQNDQTSPQWLEFSMIQWLADGHLEALQSDVFAATRELDDAMVICCNDKMAQKATMQIGR